MWQELNLLHLAPGAEAAPEGALRWRTCLRELKFLAPGEWHPQALRGLDAHRLLVEICSGLHSPLFGETEVFGQFRAFRAAQSWEAPWTALLDAVEEDVRRLRRERLRDHGAQSYGSLARKHLPAGVPVVLVGAGSLAKDLLPWLSEHPVTVAARDPRKASAELGVETHALDALDAPAGASWLVAAPLSSAALAAHWARSPAGLVLDFRGEDELREPAHAARYLGLRTLFAELEANRARHELARAEALAYAAELSARRREELARAAQHRPFGWEDAFA